MKNIAQEKLKLGNYEIILRFNYINFFPEFRLKICRNIKKKKKTGFLIWISSIFCKPKWLNLTDYHIYYIYCLFIYFYTICIFKKFHDFCFCFYFIHGIFPICHLIFITYWWKALFINKGKNTKEIFLKRMESSKFKFILYGS